MVFALFMGFFIALLGLLLVILHFRSLFRPKLISIVDLYGCALPMFV
jgi:hypothetical protein